MYNGLIDGMTLHVPNPVDKVKWVKKKDISPVGAIAVGDGYTGIPLLDWAEIPIMMDRTGRQRAKYANKNYRVNTLKQFKILRLTSLSAFGQKTAT
jgi:phosphoserine phosphatase